MKGGAGLKFGGAQTLYLQMLQDKAFLFTSIQKKKKKMKFIAFAAASTTVAFSDRLPMSTP